MVTTLDRMRQQREDVSKVNSAPFFFRLGDKQRALVRPILNLEQALAVHYHKFYDKANKKYYEAVCGREVGKPCIYCNDASLTKDAQKKKDLTPKELFFVPVWLYAIQYKKVDDNGVEILDDNDNPIWEKLHYTDKETNEEKLVSGIRVMQLAFRGTAYSKVLEAFYDMTNNGERIVDRDFIISRVGSGTDTSYVPSKRQPAPFKVQIESPLTEEWLKQRVFEVSPPVTLDDGSPSPLQGGNGASAKESKKEEAFDDTIADF